MMKAEMVSETLDFYPQMTRLVAREDFINLLHFYFIIVFLVMLSLFLFASYEFFAWNEIIRGAECLYGLLSIRKFCPRN
jgi:hypothetical protein